MRSTPVNSEPSAHGASTGCRPWGRTMSDLATAHPEPTLQRTTPTDPATEAFVAHRNLLFTVAYEMLGSAADAEDVLQETWLRWVKVDLEQVRDQRAYLVRITTRQSLNRLRTMKRRKEAYVGPWLPEPLLTAPDVAEDVELAESLSMALMLVLETLSPTERAVFVLREVFDVGYDEIAAAVDKSPAAVRQIAHRARQHVDARRPREVGLPGREPGRLWSRSSARSRPGTCRVSRRARPGGRSGERRRRHQAGRAAADHRRREGGPLHGRRFGKTSPSPSPHRGQRQPGTRRAPGRRDRRRHGDPCRGRAASPASTTSATPRN